MKKNQLFKGSLIVGVLALLPNCDLFKGESAPTPTPAKKEAPAAVTSAPHVSKDSSPVLVEFKDPYPPATKQEFELYKKQFSEAQPQYAAFLEDPMFEEQLLQGMVNERLLEIHVKENKIDQKPEYQKELDDICNFGRRSLNVKYVQESYPVAVSDQEARQYYEENKRSPQFMIEAGGVNAFAVEFDAQDKAQEFFNKVKANPAAFDTTASQEGLQVKDLGMVTQHSFNVEGPLREKILSITSFPSLEVVKVNDTTYAVVHATSKAEPKYVDFEQIKEPIKNMLKQQKMTEKMMEVIKDMESKYIEKKSDYFERKKAEKEQQAQKMAEAAEPAAQPAQPRAPKAA